jgi:hypothetical protein
MEARRRAKTQCGFYGGEKLRNRVAVASLGWQASQYLAQMDGKTVPAIRIWLVKTLGC